MSLYIYWHPCIKIFHFRFIPDPFIEEIRQELTSLEAKKQDQIDKALAEKAAKGKK